MRRNILRLVIPDESGSVSIIAALVAPVLIGGMALSAETGAWYMKQRKLQHAADMAAYAAAIRLMQGDDADDAEEAGKHIGRCTWTSTPGCQTPVAFTITITTPHGGNSKRVEAVATETVPRYVTALFGSGSLTLSGRAVAQYNRESAAKACVLALKQDSGVGVKVSGNTSVTFNGCDVVSNSGSASSFMMQSGAAVITTRCIRLSGGAQTNDAADINLQCDEIGEYKPVIVDPFKDLPALSTNVACYAGTKEVSVGPKATTTFTANVTHPSGLPVLNFCGGLRIQGTATFAPGIYLVAKGLTINSGAWLNISMTNNDANKDGIPDKGVMFYLYDGAGVTMNGQAELDLVALTSAQSAPYAGLLFYSAKGNTSTVQINGGSKSVMTGTVYAPDAQVKYAGNENSGTSGCMRIVAATVEFTGNSGVSADCSGLGGTPIYSEPTAALIE